MKRLACMLRGFRTLALFGGLVFPFTAAAQLTAYLKIDDIPGESQRDGHEDEIDFVGLSWKIERAESDGTRATARAKVGPIKVLKRIDKSSPYLALATLNGQSFPEMVITVRRDSGDAHLDYLIITMTNVRVTSYEMTTSEGTAQQASEPTEEVGFVFEEIRYKYTEMEEDHSVGAEHEIEYDIAAGA